MLTPQAMVRTTKAKAKFGSRKYELKWHPWDPRPTKQTRNSAVESKVSTEPRTQ